MSQETNWFQDLAVDEAKAERGYWRRIGFAIFAGIVLTLIILPLHGCATEEAVWQRLCHIQPLGQSEQGLLVVRQFCIRE